MHQLSSIFKLLLSYVTVLFQKLDVCFARAGAIHFIHILFNIPTGMKS